jgi:hypothetical protein
MLGTVGQLIIIAGPPAAGKTTLIHEISAGGRTDVARRLDVHDNTAWTFSSCGRWMRAGIPHVERLILHFNFLTNLRNTTAGHIFAIDFDKEPRLEVVRRAREITFLTLWAPTDVLIRRLARRTPKRLIAGIGSLSWSDARPLLKDHFRMFWLLRQQNLAVAYRSWFDFCDGFTAKAHWLANSTNGIELMPRSEWPALTGQRE